MSMTMHFAEYWELTKPRIVALLVFCAVIGMFLAVQVTPPGIGIPGWQPLIFGSLGIGLASASAAAFNHLIDQRIDRVMTRTDRKSTRLNSSHVADSYAVFCLTK